MERPLNKKWVQYFDRPYRWTWPAVCEQYVEHWGFNKQARKYAAADVTYLRELYDHFGQPEMGDNDSTLACTVACCRWRGYSVDLKKITELRDVAIKTARTAPSSAKRSLDFIYPELNETEKIVFGRSTKKTAIEELAE